MKYKVTFIFIRKQIILENKIYNVTFLGHVDNRIQLNEILRNNDIFCFASLSEGSPRVILEAMANVINIVSTAVGSLPTIFENEKDILFADFNDEKDCEAYKFGGTIAYKFLDSNQKIIDDINQELEEKYYS